MTTDTRTPAEVWRLRAQKNRAHETELERDLAAAKADGRAWRSAFHSLRESLDQPRYVTVPEPLSGDAARKAGAALIDQLTPVHGDMEAIADVLDAARAEHGPQTELVVLAALGMTFGRITPAAITPEETNA